LLRTGWSKVTTIGMPMPTVSPALGVTSLTAIVWDASRVVNLLVALAVLPSRPVAVARTVYDLPGASVHRGRQLLRSGDSFPGTPAPPDRMTTPFRVPLATLTTTPRSGRTPWAPSRGVIVSRGAATSTRGRTAVPAPPPGAAVCDAPAPTTVLDAVTSNAVATSAMILAARPAAFARALTRTLRPPSTPPRAVTGNVRPAGARPRRASHWANAALARRRPGKRLLRRHEPSVT
jgi:hypothetical protein